MGNTYTVKTVSVAGVSGDAPATWSDVVLERINIPTGPAYGRCNLRFPAAYAFSGIPPEGSSIDVRLDDVLIFRGRVISHPGAITRGGEEQRLVAVDARWELNRRKVGQWGIGPADETRGGFPEVGHQVIFNPQGARNRSESVDSETGLYIIRTNQYSQYWTRKQILGWLFGWYCEGILALKPAMLDDAWDDDEINFMPYLMTAGQMITKLANKAGQSWGVAYMEDGPYFQPVTLTSAVTVALNMPEIITGEVASNSNEASVSGFTGSTTIENSCDTVEVHSAKILIEQRHSSAGEFPLLRTAFPSSVPVPFIFGYRMDVEMYSDNDLGQNLEVGARPKRWWRHNVTRMDPYGDGYLEMGDAKLLAGVGVPLMPEDCVWISWTADEVEYTRRVKQGHRIDFANCLLFFSPTVVFATGEKKAVSKAFFAEETTSVTITVTTEIEMSAIIVSPPPETFHIDSEHQIPEPIFRSDLRPQYRYFSLLPDLAAYNNQQPVATGEEWEKYIDVFDQMRDYGHRYLAARQPAAVTAQIKTVGIVAATVGNFVSITPAETILTGREIITDIVYNAEEGDHMTLSVTNQLARLLQR